MHIYQLENIKRFRGGLEVLNIPELKILKGAILGLAGHNGSGKSTLMRVLSLLDLPDEGNLFFKNQLINSHANKDNSNNNASKTTKLWQIRRNITLLGQESYLLKRSVAGNLEYGLKIRNIKLNKSELLEKQHNALSEVGLNPNLYLKRSWQALSGGETQRVALAARLILNPAVLLLDEPTASLDEESTLLICKAALESRKNNGTTIVIVSHDIHWLKSVADSIVTLKSGQLIANSSSSSS